MKSRNPFAISTRAEQERAIKLEAAAAAFVAFCTFMGSVVQSAVSAWAVFVRAVFERGPGREMKRLLLATIFLATPAHAGIYWMQECPGYPGVWYFDTAAECAADISHHRGACRDFNRNREKWKRALEDDDGTRRMMEGTCKTDGYDCSCTPMDTEHP
jgi:hypothetical protein